MDSDQPVRIESNTLEVRDKIRQATFAGVSSSPGQTPSNQMLCGFTKTPRHHEERRAAGDGRGPTGAEEQPEIKRADFKGDVFVIRIDM